jgi:hypothetical protein
VKFNVKRDGWSIDMISVRKRRKKKKKKKKKKKALHN